MPCDHCGSSQLPLVGLSQLLASPQACSSDKLKMAMMVYRKTVERLTGRLRITKTRTSTREEGQLGSTPELRSIDHPPSSRREPERISIGALRGCGLRAVGRCQSKEI